MRVWTIVPGVLQFYNEKDFVVRGLDGYGDGPLSAQSADADGGGDGNGTTRDIGCGSGFIEAADGAGDGSCDFCEPVLYEVSP